MCGRPHSAHWCAHPLKVRAPACAQLVSEEIMNVHIFHKSHRAQCASSSVQELLVRTKLPQSSINSQGRCNCALRTCSQRRMIYADANPHNNPW